MGGNLLAMEYCCDKVLSPNLTQTLIVVTQDYSSIRLQHPIVAWSIVMKSGSSASDFLQQFMNLKREQKYFLG